MVLAGCWWGAGSAAADFGFQGVNLEYSEEDGWPAEQAGSHPFALTASATFGATGSVEEGVSDETLRDLRIVLPEGLAGTFALLPRCGHPRLSHHSCPIASAVGTIGVLAKLELEDTVLALVQAPVYNLVPSPGVGAELGFFADAPSVSSPTTIQLGLTTEAPHLLFASLSDAQRTLQIVGYQIVLWGDPGDPAHDPYRGQCGSALAANVEGFEPLSKGSCPVDQDPGVALLTLPTSCSAGAARFEATAWSGERSVAGVGLPPLEGCASLPFAPALQIAPTSRNANAPSGLELSLEQPNEGLLAVGGRASAQIGSAAVDLPPGMAINPPFAAGRGVCTRQQVAAQAALSGSGDGCPQSSLVGSAEVETPLVPAPLRGEVFVAEPDDPATSESGAENPFDSLFALYLVLKDAERGISVVQPVAVEPDPESGRVRVRLVNLPALPIERFELRVDPGPHAPLATPPSCASHAFNYSLQPSSGNAPLSARQAFSIGGNCPEPFRPRLSSGVSPLAAASSASLDLELSISSYEPSLRSVTLTLPRGLSAAVAGVPICPGSAAAKGTCPFRTRIGQVRVAVGGGSSPLQLPGAAEEAPIFLAGPFEQAPYSLAIELPARAGPFDLGTVRLRAPIAVDPDTAQATIGIERIPQIRAGVPLRYRGIRLLVDRPGFIRTPTSCAARQITGTATSADGLAEISTSLRPHGCARLPFRPSFALAASGGLGRNGHPALRAVIRSRRGEAGIAAAAFTLPAGELLDLRRIGAVCARAVSPGRCPADSRIGRARLWSPLAKAPLAGPIYLREPSDGLPGLLADLRGGGVHIILRGRTAAASGGRLRVGFMRLPDVPIGKALIDLAGGRPGILVNSTSLCASSRRVEVSLRAQNGRSRQLRPRLLPRGGC